MSRANVIPSYWEPTTPLPTVVDGPVGPQCPPSLVKHVLVEPVGDTPPTAYIGERVEVYESDAIDGALVLVLPGDEETARMEVEISRAEAREIIAGLAALL